MQSTYLFLTGCIAGVLFSLLAFWLNRALRKKRITNKKLPLSTTQEIDFQRNLQMIIQDLSQLCQKNPDLIQPYMILGNMYRINGEVQRSAVIHQNLLTEKTLSKTMRDRIRAELARDFIALGAEDQALKLLREIRERSPLFFLAQEKIIEVCYAREEFDEAFRTLLKVLKRKKSWRNRKRAGYYLALQAQQMLERGELPHAKKHARKALGYDKKCVLALYLLGVIAMEEQRYDDAIGFFTTIVMTKPEFSFLAIPKLEDAFYNKQSFMRLGEKLQELSQVFPTNSFLTLSLGKYYRKKKLFKEARQALIATLELDPANLLGQEEMAHLNQEERENDNTVSNYLSLLDDAKARKRYVCSFCHTRHPSLAWSCSTCGRWETVTADLDLLSEHKDDKPQLQSTASRL